MFQSNISKDKLPDTYTLRKDCRKMLKVLHPVIKLLWFCKGRNLSMCSNSLHFHDSQWSHSILGWSRQHSQALHHERGACENRGEVMWPESGWVLPQHFGFHYIFDLELSFGHYSGTFNWSQFLVKSTATWPHVKWQPLFKKRGATFLSQHAFSSSWALRGFSWIYSDLFLWHKAPCLQLVF